MTTSIRIDTNEYIDEEQNERYGHFDDENEQFQCIDMSNIELKADHASRPIWIADNSHIFLESFNPHYQVATDFLIAISQPVNRPSHIHEYMLTKNSLYAAVSVQLQKEDIVKVLNNICKNLNVPDKVIKFIDECTSQYGQAKLVLKDNRYFIESFKKNVIDKLLQLPSVSLGNHRIIMEKYKNNNDATQEVDRVLFY